MLRIVALKPQKKKRYAVTFDDGRTLMLACDTVWDFNLQEGTELDDKRFAELMRAAVRARILLCIIRSRVSSCLWGKRPFRAAGGGF